jgi:formate hydrogenlyase subunit 3/multisubunit Na+/H+ antiporter MnhD subunit
MVPFFILSIGILVMLVIKKEKTRKNIHLILSFGNLIIVSILLIINFGPHQEIFFNIFLSKNQYLLMALIFLFQVAFSIFVKYTSKNYPHAYLFDVFSLLIFLSLIGMVISMNFLTLISFYILALVLTGMLFYFGEFKKEFFLLKRYFITCCVGAISLILATLILYLDTGTMMIYNLGSSMGSEYASNLTAVLILLGLGIPCGLLPYSVFHLKKYFRETEYFQLVIFIVFNFITSMIIMRLLNQIIFEQITFIILIMLGLGLVIAIYYIILELFTSQDGFSYSVKKIIGYSTVADSNLILLFFVNFSIFPEHYKGNLVQLVIFLQICLVIVKLMLSYSFLQVANISNEDNVRLLGNFWKNSKVLGILLTFSGVLLIFPVSFIFIYSFFIQFDFLYPILNSLITLISSIVFSLFIITLFIILLFTAHFFIQVFINENASYLERELPQKINKNLIYIIAIFIIGMLIGFVFIFFYVPSTYLDLISFF